VSRPRSNGTESHFEKQNGKQKSIYSGSGWGSLMSKKKECRRKKRGIKEANEGKTGTASVSSRKNDR